MGHDSRGAPSATAGLIVSAALSACVDPVVEARVVWLDASIDRNGDRTVHLYDAGERDSIVLRPSDGPSQLHGLVLDLDPHGRGLVLGSTEAGVYLDLHDHRAFPLGRPALAQHATPTGFGFAPTTWYTARGDALGVTEVDEIGTVLGRRLVPLIPDGGFRSLFLAPSAEPSAIPWGPPRSAAAAPIVMFMGQAPGQTAPRDRVQALRYPESRTDPFELQLLGHGTGLAGRSPPDGDNGGERLNLCPGWSCIDPTGQTLTYTGAPCTYWQWSWVGHDDPSAATEPRLLDTPFDCGSSDPALVAALTPNLLVFEDGLRIHVLDLAGDLGGQLRSIPKLGQLDHVRAADQGAVVLFVDPRGPVLRVDARGPRVLNAAFLPCGVPGRLVTSPNGNWSAWTCGSQDLDAYEGTIVRVSALGLETFASVAMQALAIDDLGNLLLYSVDFAGHFEGEPRGLYVLSSDGKAVRIDGLEPAPVPVLFSTSGNAYFDAAPAG